MKQVYLNINNDLINDIFNLNDPDEFVIDETILELIDGNSNKKKDKKPKAEKAAKKETKKETKKSKDAKKKKFIIKIKKKK